MNDPFRALATNIHCVTLIHNKTVMLCHCVIRQRHNPPKNSPLTHHTYIYGLSWIGFNNNSFANKGNIHKWWFWINLQKSYWFHPNRIYTIYGYVFVQKKTIMCALPFGRPDTFSFSVLLCVHPSHVACCKCVYIVVEGHCH